ITVVDVTQPGFLDGCRDRDHPTHRRHLVVPADIDDRGHVLQLFVRIVTVRLVRDNRGGQATGLDAFSTVVIIAEHGMQLVEVAHSNADDPHRYQYDRRNQAHDHPSAHATHATIATPRAVASGPGAEHTAPSQVMRGAAAGDANNAPAAVHLVTGRIQTDTKYTSYHHSPAMGTQPAHSMCWWNQTSAPSEHEVNPAPASSDPGLDVEAELHHIAVPHHVLLALHAHVAL